MQSLKRKNADDLRQEIAKLQDELLQSENEVKNRNQENAESVEDTTPFIQEKPTSCNESKKFDMKKWASVMGTKYQRKDAWSTLEGQNDHKTFRSEMVAHTAIVIEEKVAPSTKIRKVSTKNESNRNREKHSRPCTRERYNMITEKMPNAEKLVWEYDEMRKSIWCRACSKEVRYDNVESHLVTEKHKSKTPETNAAVLLQSRMNRYVVKSKLFSSLVRTADHVFRLCLVRSFMADGINLNKLRPDSHTFKFLTTYSRLSLTDRSNLQRDYLPTVIALEQEDIKNEIYGRDVCVIFDETSIVWVNLCVVLRYVDDEMNIQQRVVRLLQLKDAPQEVIGSEMSTLILSVLQNTYNIPYGQVKAFVRDGAAINHLAVTKLIGGEIKINNRVVYWPGIYNSALNIKCISHTADRAGALTRDRGVTKERMRGPHAVKFTKKLVGLFCSSSNKANNSWSQTFNSSFPSVSDTRWWSQEEFDEYAFAYMQVNPDREHDMSTWIQMNIESDNLSGENAVYIYNTLCETANPNFMGQLNRGYTLVEMIAAIEFSKKIREMTYILEGDGPLSLITADVIITVRNSLVASYPTMDYPQLQAVIEDLHARNIRPTGFDEDVYTAREAWLEYVKGVIKPGYDYFIKEVYGDKNMEIFLACQLANPSTFQRVARPAAHVREVLAPLVGKLIDRNHVDRMINEIGTYMHAAAACLWDGLDYDDIMKNCAEFWKIQRRLPSWSAFAKMTYLIQPSSATVERAFSMLKYIYDDQQVVCISDTVEGTLQLRFNRGKTTAH